MTKHGEPSTLKRLNTPKFLRIKRKHGKFFVRPSPGPHEARFCLPLLHIVRDLFEIVDNYREAKKMIGRGFFKVDGRVVKDPNFPVGLMDVFSIDKIDEHYRVLPASHHGLNLNKITKDQANFKLCRINGKTTIKGGNIQLNLHDGRNILLNVKDPKNPKEDTYKRMDVLKISLPDQEILKKFEFKEDNLAIIMSGKNIGQVGKITRIKKLFGPNASTVSIEHDDELTETLYDYTFIIGEEESEIHIPEEIEI
jgi:small subunit ribosomal protein S4e